MARKLIPHCRNLAFTLLMVSSALEGSIIIDGFTSAQNDRFANDPSFIASGFDLSGVAISNASAWATLVSPNVVLSATHFNPGLGTTIRFYPTNDPGDGYITRDVASFQRIGTTDIWAGVLDSPVTGDIATYSFATEPITTATFGLSPYSLENAYLFGRSPTANIAPEDIAVGRNVVDLFFEDVDDGSSINDALITVVNESSDLNYVSFETHLQGGDSGGPMFVENNGELLLVGINWFIVNDYDIDSGPGPSVLRDLNGVSYIGNYANDIQAFIDANAPIPEPGHTSLALALSCGLLAVMRRRR